MNDPWRAPRAGARLCEAQQFLAPTHVRILEVWAFHEPPLPIPLLPRREYLFSVVEFLALRGVAPRSSGATVTHALPLGTFVPPRCTRTYSSQRDERYR
jgi:hypothetical protein